MTQSICNTVLLNHCCCNFAMLPDTFMELVWKLQLLQMFVAVLWPPCFGDNTSMFDTHLNGLLLHGHFLPLQRKNRCCNVPLAMGASIRESKGCAFYSSHVLDGNHSRPPRCQCAKANDEAATVAIVTGASILSFREILGCVSFARWLWISNLWRMPVFFLWDMFWRGVRIDFNSV